MARHSSAAKATLQSSRRYSRPKIIRYQIREDQVISGGPGSLDRNFPGLSGFLRFMPPGLRAANGSTRNPGSDRQAQHEDAADGKS